MKIRTTKNTAFAAARVAAGITQKTAARRLGVTEMYITKIESGDYQCGDELKVKASILTGKNLLDGSMSKISEDQVVLDYLVSVRERLRLRA